MPLFIEWNEPFSSVFADIYNTEDYVRDETEEEWQATLKWADDQERARRLKADSRTKLV